MSKEKGGTQKEGDTGKEQVQVICFADLKPPVPGLKLNIGSGDRCTEGFINVDLYNVNAEANWDAGHLPLNDSSCSIIVCAQTLEHFGYHEIMPILQEWYRVLKPGGEVHIVTPNIVDSCKQVVDNPTSEWALARIFGNQSHEGQFHKWGYTPQRLSDMFGFAGFALTQAGPVSISGDGKDVQIYMKATK